MTILRMLKEDGMVIVGGKLIEAIEVKLYCEIFGLHLSKTDFIRG